MASTSLSLSKTSLNQRSTIACRKSWTLVAGRCSHLNLTRMSKFCATGRSKLCILRLTSRHIDSTSRFHKPYNSPPRTNQRLRTLETNWLRRKKGQSCSRLCQISKTSRLSQDANPQEHTNRLTPKRPKVCFLRCQSTTRAQRMQV